jgi:hypothetical protein
MTKEQMKDTVVGASATLQNVVYGCMIYDLFVNKQSSAMWVLNFAFLWCSRLLCGYIDDHEFTEQN